jgi:hypothetical protein
MNQYKIRCPLIATISLAYSVRECTFDVRGLVIGGVKKSDSVSFATEESIYLISDKRLSFKTLMVSICATTLGVQKFYFMPTKFIYAFGTVSDQTTIICPTTLADWFL